MATAKHSSGRGNASAAKKAKRSAVTKASLRDRGLVTVLMPAASTPVAPKSTPTKRISGPEERRRQFRELHWPNADAVIWHRKREKGFTTIPRTLSLVSTLINVLGKGRGDASRVYIDLWSRVYDDALISISDEAEFALSAGYPKGSRNVRTWREQMQILERFGFIAVKPKSGRKYGYVLLLHPHKVVARLLRDCPESIPQWWRDCYTERLSEIRAHEVFADDLDRFFGTPSTDTITS